jgi:hypothetical protein
LSVLICGVYLLENINKILAVKIHYKEEKSEMIILESVRECMFVAEIELA